MSEDFRWSIDELLVRYDLEPQLSDVFVEGQFDKEILTQALRATRDTAIYEVDVVDIPYELLQRHGLTSGNKQRVIALSKELAQLPSEALVKCLIDRDLDHWFGELTDSPRLRWTRFCSIESHFLTPEIVRDIVLTTGRAKISQAELFVASLFIVLKTLYGLRLTDRELKLGLKWVAVRKYLSSTNDSIEINVEKYVVAVLNANSQLAKKSEFLTSYEAWMIKLDCDVRLASRGHDYTELLAWAVVEFSGLKAFGQQSSIERLFVLLARSIESLTDELQ